MSQRSAVVFALALSLPACTSADEDEDDGGASDGGQAEETFLYRALVLQMDGIECTDCPADALLLVCGEMTNTTAEEQMVSTPSSCLVNTWTVAGPGGSEELSYYCADEPADWYIQPEEILLRCAAAWTGSAGSYSLTVDWATDVVVSTNFVLQ